jgi:hypothetical protein
VNAPDRPTYQVLVGDDREHRLAMACKPDYVDAAVVQPS